jgi:cell division protein FtsA
VSDTIVGIDVGTSKVCTLVGRVYKPGQIEIIGKSLVPCNGMKKGMIVDIEVISNSIKESVGQAQSLSGLKIGSAYVNIIGAHVNVMSNRAITSITGENREITEKDIDKVLHAVKDVPVTADKYIIDVIPRQYIIDGYGEIVDPLGMVGVKLEVDADIVAGKITSVQNLVRSFERAGINIDGIIAETFATAEVVIKPNEKEVGAILIDVGGGITDVSVFKNNRLIFYNSLPVGGGHITNDISIGLNIPYADAEKIKRQYELAMTSLIKNDQEVFFNDLKDSPRRNVKVSEVIEIIEARVYEIFSLCKSMLDKDNIDLGKGNGISIILTGGGISYVDGNKQIAGEVFGLPARVASYKISDISMPEYTTAAGLIKYASGFHKSSSVTKIAGAPKTEHTQRKPGILSGFFKIIKEFF